jgi:phage terminase large subunit-like protein
VFPPLEGEDEVKILSFNFIPREKMLEKIKVDQVDYDVWEQQGYVMVTEGNVVDYNVVQAKIEECLGLYQVQSIAYDRWNATKLVQDLIAGGYEHMIPIGQGYQSMNAPSKYFETLILDKKFNHGGNPLLRWAFSNVMILMDPAGNIKPDKGKSKQRIDPIVAGIMAIDGVMKNIEVPSVYEDRGLTFL